ncbi:MAG: PEP-CTERM sorting domain-containing protein [Pirellulales bacterium]
MKKPFLSLLVLLVVSPAALADVIIDWNNSLLQAIRTEGTAPPMASRNMAMVHTAVFDAVNSIDDTYRAYYVNLNVAATTSREAAAAQAARDVLVHLYPTQAATFDSVLSTQLNAIPSGADKSAGTALGSSVAASIIALRAGDHSSDIVAYTPSGILGRWEPTMPAHAPALLPNWPTVTPWAMTSGSQFRDPVGPPDLNAAEYTAAYNEVKELGSATSATRTADQTDIAEFWADGGGTSTPPGHWNRIAQTVAQAQGNSISENARMFALLNVAAADAAIVSWDNKYATDYWRPITGIRNGDADGNGDTVGDANWTPLIATPPFPTYTSGHSTFSGAAARVLAGFFGTDNMTFTDSAEGFAVSDHSFTSFSQAAEEAMNSRLYGGIHWRFDNEDGLAGGAALGDYVLATQLQAIPEPSSLALIGMATVGIAWRWRKRRPRAIRRL